MISELSFDFPAVLAFVYTRIDPAAVFAWIACVLGLQTLVWGIARDSTDIEWWRSSLLAVLVTGISILVVALAGSEEGIAIGPILGAAFGTAFAVWLVAGILYEAEIWQRAVLAASSPVIGGLAWIFGLWMRSLIIPAG